MSSTDAYLRATLNRLSARFEQGCADAAASLAVFAQDAPGRLQQEWDLFQEEVQAEADRLDHQAASTDTYPSHSASGDEGAQNRIDRLRAKVADLSCRVEELR